MAIRKIRLGGEQLGRVQKKHVERAFDEKSIPEIKVDGIDERLAMLESKIAFLVGVVAKPLVSSDNYRFVTSDNKILKVL